MITIGCDTSDDPGGGPIWRECGGSNASPLISAGPFRFRDVTCTSGVDVRHDLGAFLDDGTGVVVGDLDGDGDDDLVFTQGVLRPLAVYRNEGRLRFTLVPQDPAAGAGGTALALGDLDRDGDLDLFVTGYDRLDFLECTPGLRFRPHPQGLTLSPRPPPEHIATPSMNFPTLGTGAIVADLDLDGMLDVAVVSRFGPEVFRNEGGWQFRAVSAAWGMPTIGYGLSRILTYADLTADGVPDLLVGVDTDAVSYDAADLPRSPQGDVLLVAHRDDRGGVRFVDESAAWGLGGARSNMGMVFSDFDADGQLDLFISNIGAKPLLLGRGAAPFERSTTHAVLASPLITSERCAASPRERSCLSFSWGLALADGDGDGDEDLFVTNGAQSAAAQLSVFERQGGGAWRAHGHEGARTRSFALIAADLDGDGDGDLIQTPFNGSAVILESLPARPVRSARVALRGRRNNPHGVGALVTATDPAGHRTTWPVGLGGAPYGAPSLDVSVPLGDAAQVDLDVRWPDGTRQQVIAVTAGRRVEVIEESPTRRDP